jgi:Dehydrogenases with different specificities (related to short-chain alcohol dehydrogenases)
MGMFTGKNAIVTGAAAGLGQVVALELAKEGANVFIGDFQDPSDTIEKIRHAGGNAAYSLCDIRNDDEVKAMVSAAADYFRNRIDILVNNAGFNGKASLVKDMKSEDWENTLDINLTGTMRVTRAVIPYMIEQNEGRIVNVASNVARRGLPYRSDYVSSKWAVLGLTQTLALELVDHNVRVNAVCPGPILVDRIYQVMGMHAEAEGLKLEDVEKDWANVPMKRFIKPEEVASVIQFLASDASSAMTGQALNVTGGHIMT